MRRGKGKEDAGSRRWREGEKGTELVPVGEVGCCFFHGASVCVCVCVCVCVFSSVTLEDAATSKATEGSLCNLCNRHKHVYWSAPSHWTKGSHYNHVRCCARSLLLGGGWAVSIHYGDCRGMIHSNLRFFRGSFE